MSGQNKQMASSRMRPPESEATGRFEPVATRCSLTACKHTERMPWYDMILPLGGHVKPRTYQRLAPLTNAPQSLGADPLLDCCHAFKRRHRNWCLEEDACMQTKEYNIFRLLKDLCTMHIYDMHQCGSRQACGLFFYLPLTELHNWICTFETYVFLY